MRIAKHCESLCWRKSKSYHAQEKRHLDHIHTMTMHTPQVVYENDNGNDNFLDDDQQEEWVSAVSELQAFVSAGALLP